MKAVHGCLRKVFFFFSLVVVMSLASAWIFRFELCYYWNRECIDAAARRYQVPASLVAAVIWQESRFNPLCRGKAGEIGYMQIMPGSAREWAREERIFSFSPEMLFDPGTNVLAGTWYLGRAIRRWNAKTDPIPYALAEYNAGRSNALRWNRLAATTTEPFAESISYPTTRAYVRTIMKNYSTFGRPWMRWRSEY